MPTDHRAVLARIKTFHQLIAYLRDEMGWPIARDSFEDVDDLFYDFTAHELGIDPKTAAKIESIKRLRPLSLRQPWGIFFVKFEPKKLPVVALRRILSQVALKKRASANSAERTAWAADDLLFVSNYGDGDERQISFAHFSQDRTKADLPILKVLGWDDRDTALHLDGVATELATKLSWPEDESNVDQWRERWQSAFTLRPDEVIKTSKGLAVELAKLARAIHDRILAVLAIETENGVVTKLMKAFQESLVHDLDASGFADMYAQTIAYGLLSARVTNPKANTADGLASQLPVTNPFLKELMETFLHVGGRNGKAGQGPGIDFDELGVSEVVELLDDPNTHMEAVVRDFGDKNPQEDPVIHFYEHFLEAYDKKQKVSRGVFYTPRPVVNYIVRSVDELLRTEFGLEDGLADTTTWGEMANRHQDLKVPEGASPDQDFVQILDPATGTGTFLVEVIDLIHKTLVAKWKGQGHGETKIESLWNDYVPTHLLTRLHGYELLMAPYAIAHLKIGLKLYETSYRFDSEERARIYLTNALDAAHDFSGKFAFAIPALAHEAQAVNEIKRDRRFTVVFGNPPYSVTSFNSNPFIDKLMGDYKKHVRGEQGLVALSDDYLKFIRISQEQLRSTGCGVWGMITNHGYLRGVIHRGVRRELLSQFRSLFILDLHGDSNVGETPPRGYANENVFDIQQGVAVAVCVQIGLGTRAQIVSHSDCWGTRTEKYDALGRWRLSTIGWTELRPREPALLLIPFDDANLDEYRAFPLLTELMPVNSCGVKTHRDGFLIDFDRNDLVARFKDVASESDMAALRKRYEVEDTPHWRFQEARAKIAASDVTKHVRAITYRPFDNRWIYYNPAVIEKGDSKYPTLRHMLHENIALLASRIQAAGACDAIFASRLLAEMKTAESTRSCTVFPLYLAGDDLGSSQRALGIHGRPANLNSSVLRLIAHTLGLKATALQGLPEGITPENIFHYAYAVFYSPGYRSRYAEFLKSDFPRLPLPGNLGLFMGLTRLGGEIASLHLMESPKLDDFITTYTGLKNPEVGRVGWSDDTVWLDAAATKKGQPATPGTIGFRGVPAAVWNFHIGGYQVCEKWLKDRKGRTLSKDDLAHYQKIVVALTETIRLMQEIDEVIEQHGGWPGAFQASQAKAAAAKVIPFRPRIEQPRPEERYVTCVPLVPLKAAAGAFSDPQHVDDDGWEWAAVDTKHRLRPGMFVAQVVGKSMEPAIPDGAYCLFAAPVTGTRQGKIVLVQLRDATDPETGERYTVKRYESEKIQAGDSWRHARITLKPVNPDFEPIVIREVEEGQVHVIAQCVEVLGGES